ncbi:AAA family ATPase [Candidatus Phytoplasma luffae]|uniref:AAA family ATPase n=1 Tax=Loofah witches'-broom phytoplasma TaxID=35773 RepID=A0A975FIQ4_LOWBP|nr:AAA family ATPase [Candidatus Phytoplasma luffae]QTX03213.1 AAA family ATPase [Candidatus Phytoplasma luffae]
MSNKKNFVIFVFVSIIILLFSGLAVFLSMHINRNDVGNNFQDDISNIPVSSSFDNETLKDFLAPREINWESFKTFDAAYGMDEQIKQLKGDLDRFIYPEKYRLIKDKNQNKQYVSYSSKNEITPPPRGVIFYGPPGTGKTFLAKCAAKEANMTFYPITSANTAQEIEETFKKARKNSPSIIFVDEAEEIIKSRDGKTVTLEEGDAKKTNIFLTQLDGISTDPDKPIYFIAATNHIDKIDSAIRSRLEELYIGYLKPEQRLGYLELMFKKYNVTPSAFEHLKKITEVFNKALEKPEKYAELITLGKLSIASIGTVEDKGPLKNLDEITAEEEFIRKYEATLKIKVPKSCEGKKLDFFKNLERVKTHFYNIQSGRKLEMMITIAANKAAFSGGSQFTSNIINEMIVSPINGEPMLNSNNEQQFLARPITESVLCILPEDLEYALKNYIGHGAGINSEEIKKINSLLGNNI